MNDLDYYKNIAVIACENDEQMEIAAQRLSEITGLPIIAGGIAKHRHFPYVTIDNCIIVGCSEQYVKNNSRELINFSEFIFFENNDFWHCFHEGIFDE